MCLDGDDVYRITTFTVLAASHTHLERRTAHLKDRITHPRTEKRAD